MSRASNFVLSVTWSWPITLLLLFFAMLPIWGPLMPPLDGMVWPVTDKVRFTNQVAVDGGLNVRMAYNKLRDCQIIGVSMDNNGVPVDFEPVAGSIDTLSTRGTGPQISRLWFAGTDDLKGVRLRWIHRCNPLWETVTVAFP